jgi:hypothetical protein
VWEGSIASDKFSFIMTNDNGQYSLMVPAGLLDSYTLVLTPAKTGYTFTPTEQILTIGTADIPNANFTATLTPAVTQAELGGTWRVNMLKAGTSQWMRSRISVNNTTGVATCLSYETSDAVGTTDCPVDFELTLTPDADGVLVTQTGNFATASHMTMSSNNQLMAGTGTSGRGYQLTIMQKEPSALTQYSAPDVQNKDFVFHSLSVGATNEWRYGSGWTDPPGALVPGLINQTPGTEFSSGVDGETLASATNTIAVDADGVVTISDIPTFQGFLSADEKTIVGTYTDLLGTSYGMMVIQIAAIGQATTMTGSGVNHLLAAGATPAWAYYDVNVTRFETTFLEDILGLTFAVNMMLSYNWETSLAYTVAQKLLLTDFEKLNIDTAGVVTIATSIVDATPVFHGQLAYDGTFIVGVETLFNGVNPCYTLNVITH